MSIVTMATGPLDKLTISLLYFVTLLQSLVPVCVANTCMCVCEGPQNKQKHCGSFREQAVKVQLENVLP